jgi:hypothetical protein
MKRLMPLMVGALMAPALIALNVHGEALPPGQVDFGAFEPTSSTSEFVEVNISSSLINLAARLVEKEEPDVAKLLRGVHQVHVNVIGLDDNNRKDIESRVQKVRKDLASKGWEKIVVAKQKDQDVGVYLKTEKSESVQGIAVVVIDGDKEAVLVNIVGDIKPEQISLIGEKLHIDALKKAGAAAEKEESR